MNQASLQRMVSRAHNCSVLELVRIMYVNKEKPGSELEQQLRDAKDEIEQLKSTVEALSQANADRCREVFNLRIALRGESLEVHAARLGLLEEFTESGIAKGYYNYNDSFDLSEVRLSRHP